MCVSCLTATTTKPKNREAKKPKDRDQTPSRREFRRRNSGTKKPGQTGLSDEESENLTLTPNIPFCQYLNFFHKISQPIRRNKKNKNYQNGQKDRQWKMQTFKKFY
jgi:hypothetical protein